MKAVCPNNPAHKEFLTPAHVMEDWKVDDKGNFIASMGAIQTDHGPNPDNIWGCVECGAEATVSR